MNIYAVREETEWVLTFIGTYNWLKYYNVKLPIWSAVRINRVSPPSISKKIRPATQLNDQNKVFHSAPNSSNSPICTAHCYCYYEEINMRINARWPHHAAELVQAQEKVNSQRAPYVTSEIISLGRKFKKLKYFSKTHQDMYNPFNIHFYICICQI